MNRITVVFIFSLLAILSMNACMPTIATQTKSMKLQVLDAESNQPIADTTIDLHYFPSMPESADPNHPHFTTNTQGEVSIASQNKAGIWQVQATDYIEQRVVSSHGATPPQYAANASNGLAGVIFLYRMPEPQLTVEIESGYSGPVVVNLQPAEGFAFVKVDELNEVFAATDPLANHIQGVAGQRQFTVSASASGVVDLVVTPLLYNLQTQQVQIQEDGEFLPYRDFANFDETERGVWGDISEDEKRLDHQFHLFVGNRKEYMAFQQ